MMKSKYRNLKMEYEEEIEVIQEKYLEPGVELPFEEEEVEDDGEEYQVKHEILDFGHEREKNEDSDDEEEEKDVEEYDEEGNLITHPKHYESEEEEEEEKEKYQKEDLEEIDKKTALQVCIKLIEYFMKIESQLTYEEEFIYRRYTIFHENRWQEMMNLNSIGLTTILDNTFDINLLMYLYEMIDIEDYTMMDKLRHMICDEVIYYKKNDKNLKKKYSTIDYFEIYSKDDFEMIESSILVDLIKDTELFNEMDYATFIKKDDTLFEYHKDDMKEYSIQKVDDVKIVSLNDLYNLCLDRFEEK